MAKKEKKAKKKYTSIGGQALMEGIMMRGPHRAVMCVRRMDGSITTEDVKMSRTTIWNKIPLIRGLVGFVQSMTMGTKALMRSADFVIEDEEKAAAAEEAAEVAGETAEAAAEEAAEVVGETAEAAAEEAAEVVGEAEKAAESVAAIATEKEGKKAKSKENKSKAEKKAEKNSKKDEKKNSDSGMGFFGAIATVLGFGLAILLFFFLPTWVYNGLLYVLPEEYAAVLRDSKVWKSVIEGVLKLIIFMTYMVLISGMKDIKRLFQYHGAEHKCIFCYEAGEELTVENVRKYKRFHPRCGTSFIILMLLVGIAAGIVITALLPSEYDENMWIRPLIKVALIPAIMGVGYELLKFAGKHDNILTRIISAPGLWMQRISTREPDDDQIECAIAALKPVIPEDGEDMK
ncbi:MAG: DUF1385 domain-containing protein [Ruminococcaceae bacterium]|nr:DUF1385 domain-containing protein [Oscillospiraceae bacterium]